MSAKDSLIALACADAYGNYYEMEGLFGAKWKIDDLPETPITNEITDDTKMALILWRHYEKHGTDRQDLLFMAYRIMKRYEWQTAFVWMLL